MSYRKKMEAIQDIIIKESEKSNKIRLLHKKGDNYYHIKENIAYVKSINSKQLDNGANCIVLMFDGGQCIEAAVHLKDTGIAEGCFVSTYGYFTTYNGKITYCCWGGINRIYSNAKEIPQFYYSKRYCMGIVTELSKVEIEQPYNIKGEVYALKYIEENEEKDTKLYYVIEKGICSMSKILDKVGENTELQKQRPEVVNTANIQEEKIEDDYPDMSDENDDIMKQIEELQKGIQK